MGEKGSRHDNTVNCENDRDHHKNGDNLREKEEKSLESVIEEKLEEKVSVDVDVRRRGPILWISTEEGQGWGLLSTYFGACCCCCCGICFCFGCFFCCCLHHGPPPTPTPPTPPTPTPPPSDC